MTITPFSTSLTLRYGHPPILITGQSYYYGPLFPDDPLEDQYGYDLDTILYKGTDITDLLTAQYGGPKEWDVLHDAVMARIVNSKGVKSE